MGSILGFGFWGPEIYMRRGGGGARSGTWQAVGARWTPGTGGQDMGAVQVAASPL